MAMNLLKEPIQRVMKQTSRSCLGEKGMVSPLKHQTWVGASPYNFPPSGAIVMERTLTRETLGTQLP